MLRVQPGRPHSSAVRVVLDLGDTHHRLMLQGSLHTCTGTRGSARRPQHLLLVGDLDTLKSFQILRSPGRKPAAGRGLGGASQVEVGELLALSELSGRKECAAFSFTRL